MRRLSVLFVLTLYDARRWEILQPGPTPNRNPPPALAVGEDGDATNNRAERHL